MTIILFFLYIILTAVFLALWEIQIEGSNGWAAKLPTWQKKNNFTKVILGGRPLTGYHLLLVFTILTLIHLSVFFTKWSWHTEAMIIGFFLVMITLEDFLWFVLNPAWGLSKFKRSDELWWHPSWFIGLPTFYWFTLTIGILAILWGFAIIG
ncbi:MAG: hypothetical protein V1838_04545 [Patescibacteria group bacterium]